MASMIGSRFCRRLKIVFKDVVFCVRCTRKTRVKTTTHKTIRLTSTRSNMLTITRPLLDLNFSKMCSAELIDLDYLYYVNRYIRTPEQLLRPIPANCSINDLLNRLVYNRIFVCQPPYETEFTVRCVYNNNVLDSFLNDSANYSCLMERCTNKFTVYYDITSTVNTYSVNFYRKPNEQPNCLPIELVYRYDMYNTRTVYKTIKARLYHEKHSVGKRDDCWATIGVAKELHMGNFIFEDKSFDSIRYNCDNRFMITCYYFNVKSYDGKPIRLRVAFKRKQKKTMLEIECETENVAFNVCSLMYVCQEYYAWQVSTYNALKTVTFDGIFWKGFVAAIGEKIPHRLLVALEQSELQDSGVGVENESAEKCDDALLTLIDSDFASRYNI